MLTILLWAATLYAAGYALAVAVFLAWTAGAGPPGVVGPFVWALAWPAWLAGWLTNSDRPDLINHEAK